MLNELDQFHSQIPASDRMLCKYLSSTSGIIAQSRNGLVVDNNGHKEITVVLHKPVDRLLATKQVRLRNLTVSVRPLNSCAAT